MESQPGPDRTEAPSPIGRGRAAGAPARPHGTDPPACFGWTEGNPIGYVLKYLFPGEGDTAPVTREMLRRTIKNPLERPRIHVG